MESCYSGNNISGLLVKYAKNNQFVLLRNSPSNTNIVLLFRSCYYSDDIDIDLAEPVLIDERG